ncbi:MAG: hypothetical protein ABI220_02925 [Candidatus Saccharimonadales bacterium]
MKMFRRIGIIFAGIVGFLMIVAGLFVAIAGASGGLAGEHPSALSKVGVSATGVTTILIGLYLFYLANGKDLTKTISKIIDFFVDGTWS